MLKKDLLINYFYNSVLNFLNLLFPLITFPYISRVLGVESVGRISFILSISNYFILIATLGIPIYGLREVAKYKDDRVRLEKLFSEIFSINLISVIFFSIIYIVLINSITSLSVNKWAYYIVGVNLLLSAFQFDWLFRGLEDFKLVTIRSFLAKLLSIILMLLLVRNTDDSNIYLSINVVALSLANIFNVLHARKIVSIKLKGINLLQHLKPIIIFMTSRVMTSVYTVLDTVMLGFISTDYHVGLYTSAIRLNRAVVVIVTSLTAVLLPRASVYLKKNEIEKYNRLTSESLYFLLLLSVPCAIGIFLYAKEILLIFAGIEFLAAISSLRILSFLIIVIALSNFTGVQVLYCRNEEKKVTFSLFLGAVTNITLNAFLIPKFDDVGAAIATLAAELVILIYQIFSIRIVILEFLNWPRLRKFFFGIVLWVLGGVIIKYILINIFSCVSTVIIIIGIPLTILIYYIIFILLKEDLVLKVHKRVLNLLFRY